MMGANITKVLSSENNGSIKIWGKGERRDLLYISDFLKAVDNSLKINEKFGIFNVGAGKSEPVKRVIELIIKTSDKNIMINHDLSKPTIPTNIEIDYSKFKSATDEVRQYRLKQESPQLVVGGWKQNKLEI